MKKTAPKVYQPFGYKVEYDIVPWRRAEKMLDHKKADAMLCVLKDSKYKTPSYPLFVDHTAIIFKKNKFPEWKGLKTLNGKIAAWPKGYNYHKQPQFKGISIRYIEISTPDGIFTMLSRNRVDCYIDALVDIDFYIKNNNINMETFSIEIPYSKNTFIGFSDSIKSNELIELYNKRIPELILSGELKNLFQKWGVRYEIFHSVN
ncbi:transporter substrate-binding domain-containing protein [Desulfobacterales bacterium HSG17]|nr:transporter substrate-binding domain-containing protein [Desulfobacterales bacterium HSG17]